MSLIGLLVVLGYVTLDGWFSRQQDPATFARLLRGARIPIGIYAAVWLLIFLTQGGWAQAVEYGTWGIVPAYLLWRLCFKRALPAARRDPRQLGLRLSLILDALGVTIWWALGMAVLSVAVYLVIAVVPAWESELGELVVLSVLSSILMLFLIRRATRKYAGVGLMQVLGLVGGERSWLTLAVLPALVGIGLAALSSFILLGRTVQPATSFSGLLESSTSAMVSMGFVFVAVLLAPFFEEVIFRGYFFYVLERARGRSLALVVIAAVFGLMHFEQYWGDWAAIVLVSSLGVVLTAQRAWTGSSIPGIVTHYMYNGAMTVIPMIVFALSYPDYARFQARYDQLNFDQRQQTLQQVIRRHPDLAGPYNDLAWIYAEQETNLPEALRLIDQALLLDPGQYAFLDTKAEVLYKMGRVDEAVAIAQDLVDHYPANAYSRRQLEKFQKGAAE